MTTSSSSRPPLPTLATKSPSTSQSSRLNAVASDKNTSVPRASSRVPRNSTPRQDGTVQDPTSERATLSLIRRTLVADGTQGTETRASSPSPIEGILPPLTSSNEIDVQLYAIVAIVIKDFVNSWYSKITPDHVFVDEVIQIIAHCSRAFEQRIRQLNIPELMLDELPVLVVRHIEAHRTATTAQAVWQYGEDPRRIYHSLNPHPALDPSLPPNEQRDCESAYRQLLVQGALAVLLPTEDLANACLRTLVTDIIADLILGQALAEKICQPWFLHGTVSRVVGIVTSRPSHAVHSDEALHEKDRQSRLEKFGLLSANSADQEHHSSTRHQSTLSAWFWGLLQYAFIAYQSLRFVLVGMAHAHNLSQRVRHHHSDTSTSFSASQTPPFAKSQSIPDAEGRSPRAVINYRIFSCISAVLDLSTRMPWLASSLAFWQYVLNAAPGKLGATNSTLDKFLYNTLSTRLFPPSLLPPLLLQVRAILFPNNTLGPPAPPPPTTEEARVIRSQAASDILSIIPKPVARAFFAVSTEQGGEEAMRLEIEESMLCWTSDVEMNKYLIYSILEHVLVRLVPEMQDKTPSELLAERGVLVGAEAAGEEGVVAVNGETH